LRLETISHEDPARRDPAVFRAFHALLERSFPAVHAALRRETVADLSLLYTWTGRDPSLSPIALLAHMDVVPVVPGTEASWSEPPYAGRIRDGVLFGRGALDDKSGVLGILEAVERLLHDGFQPRRSVYLAFGHDEEVAGSGARATAQLLAERGVRLEYVLDEGGAVTRGVVPGVERPVALVGVAEKGYLSVELLVEVEGGHSSRPPAQTAVGIVAAAVAELEREPLPPRIAGATRTFFERLTPALPFALRLVTANLWLTSAPAAHLLAFGRETGPMVRTTTAATIIEGGVKENVLPIRGRAVVNFRILPGDSIEGVLAHVRRVVDDPRVSVRALGGGNEPSGVSSADSAAFARLERAIRGTFGDAVVVPYLVGGGTDSRHYAGVAEDVYRFAGVEIEAADLATMHGTDERIAVAAYARAIECLVRLLREE
jgi:carboxypeptidase PM20D1